CTLYRLLTGHKPYRGDTPIQILLAHREAPIPSILEKRPDVPAELDAVFQKMMAKTPEDRYQSMTEVVAALETCVAPQPVAAEPSSDSALTSFFQRLAEDDAAGKPKSEPTGEPEETFAPKADRESGGPVWRRLGPLGKPDVRTYAAIAGGVAAFLVVLVVLFTLVGGGNDEKPQPGNPIAAADRRKAAGEVAPGAGQPVPPPQAPDGTSNGRQASRAAQPEPFGRIQPLANRWLFSEPVNLGPTLNSELQDTDPVLSADALTIIFSSTRLGGHGGADLWLATRSSLDEAFGLPVNLGETVNTTSQDFSPDLSADGLTLVFASNRPGGHGDQDLWMCSRRSLAATFGEACNLGPSLNSNWTDAGASFSKDGLTLLFHSIRPGGAGSTDLWISSRQSLTGTFGEPLNVGWPVNSGATEKYPCLCAEGLVILFESDRPGGEGQFDLWMCSRPLVERTFDEPVNLGLPVNPTRSTEGRFCPLTA
ncbi:MAG: PD40 domain-containing protein, partial [Planctomycetes bacterium]|nr:PD40 domain-containing protein [Planctomycetota bacterium]